MSLDEIKKAERKEMVDRDVRKDNGRESEEPVESIVIPRRNVHDKSPYIILYRKPPE